VSTLGGAVGVGCCWLVAVVFAISAVGKLRTAAVRAAFRRSVTDMAVLPARAVSPVAVTVPIAEAAAVVLLVVPPTAQLGGVLALGLLAAFTTGIVLVLRRGTRAGCLCFGTTERPYGPRHLFRNGLLGAAAAAAAVLSGRPTDLPVTLIAIAVGAVTALVVVTFDELLDLFDAPAHR
jgi:methylamine utilization protein MauE